jgi:hypothetical protein
VFFITPHCFDLDVRFESQLNFVPCYKFTALSNCYCFHYADMDIYIPISPIGEISEPIGSLGIYKFILNLCVTLKYLLKCTWPPSIDSVSRSQWPRGLRHELSSPAPTLRSWIRIPLRHGCLCVFCVRCFCFYIVSKETASRPKKRLMRTYHWISLFMSYIKSTN